MFSFQFHMLYPRLHKGLICFVSISRHEGILSPGLFLYVDSSTTYHTSLCKQEASECIIQYVAKIGDC